MAELQPGERPKFDFKGSLELAAMMYATARSLEAVASTRKTSWDEVLVGWEGDVGKRFQDIVDQEQEDLKNVVSTLEANAQDWATQWVNNVDETNDVIRAEVWEEYKKLLDKKDEGIQISDLWDEFGGDHSVSDVPSPAPAPTPQAQTFVEPREPFIHYNVSEDGVQVEGYREVWPTPA